MKSYAEDANEIFHPEQSANSSESIDLQSRTKHSSGKMEIFSVQPY